MAEMKAGAPRAAWYPDPAREAAYRWWDGSRWTTSTRDDVPGQVTASPQPVSPRPAEQEPGDSQQRAGSASLATGPHEAQPAATASTPLPSRRSLRPASEASPPASAAAPPAPKPYVPVNPLGAARVPSSPETPGWHTPESWIANAPAGTPAPGYGQYPGALQVSGYGRPTPPPRGYSTASQFTHKPTVMPMEKGINRSARNGMALGILSVLVLLIVVSASIATGRLLVVWSFWGLAGLIWSIVGLVKARRWEAAGFVPVGARRAVAGIVLCSVALLAQGTESGLALAAAVQPAGATSVPPPGTAAGTTGGAGSPTTAPVVAVVQGDGTYAYSQAQAQSSIGAAYAATLHSTPTSVACPAAEPMGVSVSFACTVTLPGGAVTTAQVTVMDAQGHAEVQVH